MTEVERENMEDERPAEPGTAGDAASEEDAGNTTPDGPLAAPDIDETPPQGDDGVPGDQASDDE